MQSRGKKYCSNVLSPGSDDTISVKRRKNWSSACTSNKLNFEISTCRTHLYDINILNKR